MFHHCRCGWRRWELSKFFSKLITDFKKPGDVITRKCHLMCCLGSYVIIKTFYLKHQYVFKCRVEKQRPVAFR